MQSCRSWAVLCIWFCFLCQGRIAVCTGSTREESLRCGNRAAPFPRSRILLSSRPGHRTTVARTGHAGDPGRGRPGDVCACVHSHRKQLALRGGSQVLQGLLFPRHPRFFIYSWSLRAVAHTFHPGPSPGGLRGKFLGCIRPMLDLTRFRPVSYQIICHIFLRNNTFLTQWKHLGGYQIQ